MDCPRSPCCPCGRGYWRAPPCHGQPTPPSARCRADPRARAATGSPVWTASSLGAAPPPPPPPSPPPPPAPRLPRCPVGKRDVISETRYKQFQAVVNVTLIERRRLCPVEKTQLLRLGPGLNAWNGKPGSNPGKLQRKCDTI